MQRTFVQHVFSTRDEFDVQTELPYTTNHQNLLSCVELYSDDCCNVTQGTWELCVLKDKISDNFIPQTNYSSITYPYFIWGVAAKFTDDYQSSEESMLTKCLNN